MNRFADTLKNSARCFAYTLLMAFRVDDIGYVASGFKNRKKVGLLIKIQPLQSGYPAIYLSDRRCTIGSQLYLPRLMEPLAPLLSFSYATPAAAR